MHVDGRAQEDQPEPPCRLICGDERLLTHRFDSGRYAGPRPPRAPHPRKTASCLSVGGTVRTFIVNLVAVKGTCLRCGGALRPSQPFAWCPNCRAVTVVVRPGYVLHEDWTDLAACRGMDQAVFFPHDNGHFAGGHAYDEAKGTCGRCPVRAECLVDWLDMPSSMQHYGVRAGFLPRPLLNAMRSVKRLASAA